MSYDFEDVQKKVKCSIDKLRDYDRFLLKENVNERSITHKLAEYLQQDFKNLDVDCEYNRMLNGNSNDPKRMIFPIKSIKTDDTEAKTVFPDIIIHDRDSKDENLLVIEVKKKFRNRINTDFDIQKLKTFTSTQFNYSFGLHIIFYVNSKFEKSPILHWYVNGELMKG